MLFLKTPEGMKLLTDMGKRSKGSQGQPDAAESGPGAASSSRSSSSGAATEIDVQVGVKHGLRTKRVCWIANTTELTALLGKGPTSACLPC